MISKAELQAILDAQPLCRMQKFAKMLGWRGLRLEYMRLNDEEAAIARIQSGVVIYYITQANPDFNLQINTYPHEQTRLHSAVVVADRYNMVGAKFHPFELFKDDLLLRQEAQRLYPKLAKRVWKDPQQRLRLAKEHAEEALEEQLKRVQAAQ